MERRAFPTRDDGYVLRKGRPEDREGLLGLIALQHDPEDVPEAALLLDDPHYGAEGWLVAGHGGAVAACIAPLPGHIRIGSVEMPSLQIELVASHPEHAGRGLVRDLFRLMEATRTEALVHLVVGIPYFYRRLGYEYAIPHPPERLLTGASVPAMPPEWTVTPVRPGDLPALEAAQTTMAARADVAARHTGQAWRWYLASPNYDVIQAHGPNQVAYARVYRWQGDVYVFDIAAASPEGITALAAAAAHGPAAGGGEVVIQVRPAIAELVDGIGEPVTGDDWYYARIPEPVRFLEALRPELGRRLARSDLAGASGSGLLSLYTSSIRFDYAAGVVGEMTAGPAVPAPVAAGGFGVAPDHFAELALGPAGIDAMGRRYADVLPGRGEAARLSRVLFPPQLVDVQTWVYP